MKKKILILICLIVFMCGCGTSNKSSLDMSKAVAALDEKYDNMNSISKDELEAIYGLDTSLFEQYAVKSSSLNNGNLYAIIKVDSKNQKAVKEDMKEMFTVLENQSNLYSPEAVKLLKNKLETSVGDYLIYIVSDDNQSYYDEIKGFIK